MIYILDIYLHQKEKKDLSLLRIFLNGGLILKIISTGKKYVIIVGLMRIRQKKFLFPGQYLQKNSPAHYTLTEKIQMADTTIKIVFLPVLFVIIQKVI